MLRLLRRAKLLPLPDKTVVCPGHGPMSDIGYKRESNPFLLVLSNVEGDGEMVRRMGLE